LWNPERSSQIAVQARILPLVAWKLMDREWSSGRNWCDWRYLRKDHLQEYKYLPRAARCGSLDHPQRLQDCQN
jgi:hypothetical protein